MTINIIKNYLSLAPLFLVLLLTMLFSAPYANAQSKVYNWKLAYTWPTDFPLFTVSIKNMAKHAKELSNGRLNIIHESSTVHKKPLGIFDMVQSNEYQMGQSVGFYWQKKDVNTAILASVPFGMIAQERYGWFYHGGGKELTEKVYKKYGLKIFPSGNVGMQMGGWYKKEINSLEDLKGLKIRIPGLGGTIMQKIGVEPTNMQAGQLYKALESGELDAVEWANPGIDLNMKFYEHAKYYYTGWQEPAVELQFLVNEKAYNDLPKDLQKVLTTSMKLAAFEGFINYHHGNITKFKQLLTDHPDIKIRAFPTKVIRALAKETRKALEEIIKSGDPLTKEILNSQLNYLKDARQWTRFGDQAYLSNTVPLLPFK